MRSLTSSPTAIACTVLMLAVGTRSEIARTADDKVPITTSSSDARELYLEGRDLAEQLRATDARRFYEQAVAKDANFALGYIGLANTSGTTKGFIDAVTRAAALADSEAVTVINKGQVPEEVKEATRRNHVFEQGRLAVARGDLAPAKARAEEYATQIAPRKAPFEVRQQSELRGLIALAEKRAAAAVQEFAGANQQDPNVLYLTALALREAGDTTGRRPRLPRRPRSSTDCRSTTRTSEPKLRS